MKELKEPTKRESLENAKGRWRGVQQLSSIQSLYPAVTSSFNGDAATTEAV